MTQPKFAPIQIGDEVRPFVQIEPPRPWVAHRPGEFVPETNGLKGRGIQGPDQGYALALAQRFADQVQLAHGEHEPDVLTAGVAIALRRAALYGRAPVLKDIELALSLLGYLGEAPEDLVEFRKPLIAGISHDNWSELELVEHVRPEALRLSPEQARSSLSEWKNFFCS